MSTQGVVPAAPVALGTICAELILYGGNCVLFIACTYILLSRHSAHPFVLASITASFTLATAHVALSIVQLYKGFTTPDILSTANGPDLYFALQNTPIMASKIFIYATNLVVQNLLLLWRLYIVWDKRWIVAFISAIFEVGHIGTSYAASATVANPSNGLFSPAVQACILAAWLFNIAINISVTVGIAYRLWVADKKGPYALRKSIYKTSMFIIIESGAILPMADIAFLVLDLTNNIAGNLGTNSLSQLATIVPLLIIVRVSVTHYGLGTSPTVYPAAGSQNRQVEVGVSRAVIVDNESQELSAFPIVPKSRIDIRPWETTSGSS